MEPPDDRPAGAPCLSAELDDPRPGDGDRTLETLVLDQPQRLLTCLSRPGDVAKMLASL